MKTSRLPSRFPIPLPHHEIPSLEEFKSYVEQIPAERAKVGYTLYELGLLRIELHTEFNERLEILADRQEYGKAVELMDEYAVKVAIPFNGRRLKFTRLSRLRG